MSYRTRNIVMASGLALLAVIFMVIYVSKARNGDDSLGKGVITALFAARDIQQGTPGSALQDGAFVRRKVARNATVPNSISTPTEVRGEIVTQDILAGEPVTARKFGPVTAVGVRARITGYERVVQLSGDPNQVLEGTLKAGDRVDVLGTWTPVGCDRCKMSGIIVRNALVLETSGALTGSGTSGEVPVQLRLTDEQANAVFWMQKNGAWWLMLRPVIKPRSTSLSYSTASSILKELKRRGLIR